MEETRPSEGQNPPLPITLPRFLRHTAASPPSHQPPSCPASCQIDGKNLVRCQYPMTRSAYFLRRVGENQLSPCLPCASHSSLQCSAHCNSCPVRPVRRGGIQYRILIIMFLHLSSSPRSRGSFLSVQLFNFVHRLPIHIAATFVSVLLRLYSLVLYQILFAHLCQGYALLSGDPRQILILIFLPGPLRNRMKAFLHISIRVWNRLQSCAFKV